MMDRNIIFVSLCPTVSAIGNMCQVMVCAVAARGRTNELRGRKEDAAMLL